MTKQVWGAVHELAFGLHEFETQTRHPRKMRVCRSWGRGLGASDIHPSPTPAQLQVLAGT